MVLGAGAMRSAGLKNITAKHLAMASQSISILINIIPYTRECLRRHLRAKQAVILVDFDKVKRDCQEHQNEIHAKLVAIMGDRLAVHCKTLQGLDWENPAPEAGKPNAYMETLVKETGTLHKVLLRYLAGNALEIVMMQVLSAINSRLAEEYSKIPLKSAAAKDRMLVDANFLKDKFADLKGLERPAPGAELVHLVQDKPVEQPRPPLQTKGRQFSTPSMTRPQKTAASHVRTPSTLSVTQAESAQSASETPSQPEERANTTEALGDTAKSLPTLDTTGKAPDKEDATVEVASEETVSHEAVQIPLPKSPEGEEQPSISEVIASVEAARPASKEDNAPATPLKDERAFSPPVPEKHDNAGTPTGNVKNRLASLFAKRPSIPAIEVPALPIHLPKIAVPTLHHSNASRAPTESASEDQRTPQEEIQPADGDKLDSSHIVKSAAAASAGSDLVQPTKESIPEPGQVIINSSEGSTEDLAVQTTSDSLVETDVSEPIATGETPKQAQNVGDKQAPTGIETEELAVGPASPEETFEAEGKPMTIETEPDEDHRDASTSSSKPEIEDNDSAMNTPATGQDTQEPADTSGSTENTFVTESDASAEEATTAAGGNDLDDID